MRCTRTHGGLPTTTSNPPAFTTSAKCVAKEKGSAPPDDSDFRRARAPRSWTLSSASSERVAAGGTALLAEQIVSTRGDDHVAPHFGDGGDACGRAPRARRCVRRGPMLARACASERRRRVHNAYAIARSSEVPTMRTRRDVIASEGIPDAHVAVEVRQRRDVCWVARRALDDDGQPEAELA